MLVVTLKEKEKLLIGNDISVMVVEIRGNQIRLGIEAPADLLVLREKHKHKAKPLVPRQDVGQTLPDRASCLLCLHPAPWPQPPQPSPRSWPEGFSALKPESPDRGWSPLVLNALCGNFSQKSF